jgi:UDP-N-acetyl-D-glucosamine dehydrogenase
VVGLGYVGLPLALAFVQAGSRVVGLDSDSRRVEAIRAAQSYVEDVPVTTSSARCRPAC